MFFVGEFAFGATKIESLPIESVPEIAVAGRSNCGKSSMINAIFKRNKLARVSSGPGCTKQINFYSVKNHPFIVVDLPGYGYAKASKQKIREYSELINYYLLNRSVLKVVFILVDAKIGLKDSDIQFSQWLCHYRINFVFILTKIDKICESLLSQRLEEVSKTFQPLLGSRIKYVYPISVKSGIGVSNIVRAMVDLTCA